MEREDKLKQMATFSEQTSATMAHLFIFT